MKLLLFALALGIPTASACIYDDEPCIEPPQTRPAIDPAPLRNPYTGECESYWNGGGGGGGTCGDYEFDGLSDRAPVPDWGVCYGFCESLGEDECLSADECRGIYTSTCGGDVPCELSETSFSECWSVATGPGFSEEGCGTYDADECSRHNECSAVHAPKFNGGAGDFNFCTDESGGPGSCTGEVICRALPPECPSGTTPGISGPCWSGFCIPLDQCETLPSCDGRGEEACVATSYCDPIYQGVNCVCEGDECVCERWDYQSCEGSTIEPTL